MKPIVVLDTSPLSLLCHTRNTPDAKDCRTWLSDLVQAGRRVVLPEMADYELRRELMLRTASAALIRLDQLAIRIDYLPITTYAMRLAAFGWATVRQAGLPTAADPAVDSDAIIAAQALELGVPVIVATSNPSHMRRFLPAEDWRLIMP